MSIDVDEFQDIKSGYSITLVSFFCIYKLWFPSLCLHVLNLNWQAFSSNPYFEDTKLTKTCSFSDDGKITVKATTINWKDGMVLCLVNRISASAKLLLYVKLDLTSFPIIH